MNDQKVQIGSMKGSNYVPGTVHGNVEANANIYTSEQERTLAEAAQEIQELLEQLSKTNESPETTTNLSIASKTIEEIERDPVLKQRIMKALKWGGSEALKELIDHPAINVLLAAIEGWNNSE